MEEENNLDEAFANTFDDDDITPLDDEEEKNESVVDTDEEENEDEDKAWGDEVDPEDEIPDMPFKDDE